MDDFGTLESEGPATVEDNDPSETKDTSDQIDVSPLFPHTMQFNEINDSYSDSSSDKSS